MLSNNIDKAKFDLLPDILKGEYKEVGGNYILQHDEDNGALKRSKDHEKQRADNLVRELNDERNAHAATKQASDQKGSPLEIATRAKAEALESVKPTLDRAARLEASLKSQELQTIAEKLAVKIGGEKNKVALLPHVLSRLDVALDDQDKPSIIVKGADGKTSTLKLDALETELRGNTHLSSLVVVGQGSGGAGGGRQQNGPTVQLPAIGDGTPDFGKMTAEQTQAYIAAKYVSAAN